MWKKDPLTSQVLESISNYRQEIQESLGRGLSLDLNSLERTGLKTAKFQGLCEGLSAILDMKGMEND